MMNPIIGYLAILCLMASPALAGTCLSQSSTPTFQAGQAVPQVCDVHGSQKVLLVDANGALAALRGDAVMLAKQIEAERAHVAALRREHAELMAEIDRMMAVLVGVRTGDE